MKEIHIHKYERSVDENDHVIYTCNKIGCGYSVDMTEARKIMETEKWNGVPGEKNATRWIK